jgi:hypothetical protein
MKLIFLKVIIAFGLLNLMCTTKVSEWVLINTVPNQYTLVYYSNTPVSESVSRQNAEIFETLNSANIEFRNADKKDLQHPYYGLYYGNRLFSKYDNPGEMKNLSSSPVRMKIASELMAGKLCVMLYLTTDNKEKDEKGLKLIQKSVDSSPFKDIITLVVLSRNSVEEAHFASLLLNVESDLKSIPEPMLFGIFGRFKALEPLLGRGITEENIKLMINFLTADCSCLIKDNLPGTDILFTNNWDNPAPALLNKILDANPSLIHQ